MELPPSRQFSLINYFSDHRYRSLYLHLSFSWPQMWWSDAPWFVFVFVGQTDCVSQCFQYCDWNRKQRWVVSNLWRYTLALKFYAHWSIREAVQREKEPSNFMSVKTQMQTSSKPSKCLLGLSYSSKALEDMFCRENWALKKHSAWATTCVWSYVRTQTSTHTHSL